MYNDLDADGTLNGVKPKFVTEKPEHSIWTSYYLQAFYRLTSSRQSGMGLGYIPYSEISKYYYDFNVEDLEKFVTIIQATDRAYVAEYNKKDDKK